MVARVRRLARIKRVGHTGTLDPLATGVLVLCLGKATRLIPYLEEAGGPDAKEYEAVIRFGFETTTDDAEGEPRDQAGAGIDAPESAIIAAALKSFVGEINQVPPAFSAKKIDGERAYAVARRGDEVVLEAVKVQVAIAALLAVEGQTARVRFACSRGTYIRSLARDLGRALGIGAHLVELRRLRSGAHGVTDAIRLDDLNETELGKRLKPMASILEAWPRFGATVEQVNDLRLGRAARAGASLIDATRYQVCDAGGDLVALAKSERGSLKPFCVF